MFFDMTKLFYEISMQLYIMWKKIKDNDTKTTYMSINRQCKKILMHWKVGAQILTINVTNKIN